MNGWMDYDLTPQVHRNNAEEVVLEGILQKSATATAGQTLLSLR